MILKPRADLAPSILRVAVGSFLAVSLGVSPALAGLTVFQGSANFAAFNTAAGTPPIAVDFDSLSGDIEGDTINGVTFSNTAVSSANSLDVVLASSTFSPAGFGGPGNVLPTTSGTRILSPGGSELVAGPAVGQLDSLRLDFVTPVSAFGLDVLFQSLDGVSIVGYQVLDQNLVQIGTGSLSIANAGGSPPPGGSHFIGFVGTSGSLIGRVVFNENDSNAENPDSNVGYDTFRFVPPASDAIPEPRSWALMIAGFGLAGAAFRRRKTAIA